jgi:hypothetical protein
MFILLLLLCGATVIAQVTCTPTSKKGVGAAAVANSDPNTIDQLNISWYYDWTPDNGNYKGYTGNAIYVPEFWNASLIMPVSGNFPWIFTFNEPDVSNQSDMTVAQAIAVWPEVEADSDGKMIGAPNVAGDLVASDGAWLATFMSDVNSDGYAVNFLALHAYPDGNETTTAAQVSSFENYITGVHNLYPSYPVVVSEFALANRTTWNGANITEAEQVAFMDNVIPWMESQSWIIGYSWYEAYAGGYNSDLLNGNGTLSDIGTAFSILGCSATTATPGFAIAGTSVTVSPGATTNNTSTITVAASGGFTGNVTLTATITSSPPGAEDTPSLSFGTTSPVSISATAAAGSATLTISTTSATSAALAYPKDHRAPFYAAGSAVLACILLFGIPARRRRWQKMLGFVFFLIATTSGVLACGGGSGSGSSPNTGTTTGTYVVSITGADTSTGNITSSTTINVTVN